mmetsp:Transcript_34849/g.80583  ORF Transcript_34849/g.80583 Transcript_34849/m.80583 type:complete len:115 (-) Transcript_34849:2001-2345(-)
MSVYQRKARPDSVGSTAKAGIWVHSTKAMAKFIGRCDKLKDFVFELSDGTKDINQFVKSKKEIAKNIGATMKGCGTQVKDSILLGKEVPILIPSRLPVSNKDALTSAELELLEL